MDFDGCWWCGRKLSDCPKGRVQWEKDAGIEPYPSVALWMNALICSDCLEASGTTRVEDIMTSHGREYSPDPRMNLA